MNPEGLQVDAPGNLAAEADQALLDGDWEMALTLYSNASVPGIYEQYLEACLRIQRGELKAAHALSQRLVERGRLLRSAHLLEEYVRSRRARPSWTSDRCYLEAVLRVAGSRKVNLPATMDPLQDLLEARILRPAKNPTQEFRDPLLTTFYRADREAARELLNSSTSIAQSLIALKPLLDSEEPLDQTLVLEALDILQAEEPDNAYFDYLLALASGSPALVSSLLPEFPQFPEQSRRSLTTALSKRGFDAHLDELADELRASWKRAGAILLQPLAQEIADQAFLGFPQLESHLVTRAVRWAPTMDRESWQILAQASAHLLRLCSEQFPASTLPGAAEERQQLALLLLEAGHQTSHSTEALESILRHLPPPTPRWGTATRRAVFSPPPIPELVEALSERYDGRTEQLWRDLQGWR